MELCMEYYAKDAVERLQKAGQTVIFGARLVAVEAAFCLMGNPYHLDIPYFLVSGTEGNPTEVLGRPVISLKQAKEILPENVLIVIAVMEKHLKSIVEGLHQYGFYNLLSLTFESDLWSDIRGNYFMGYCRENQKEYRRLEEVLGKQQEGGRREADGWQKKSEGDGCQKRYVRARNVCIYTAKCHVDRELQEDLSRYSWEIPIQVGAALTKEEICDVKDNTGENISEKNREYCELTALYWIWKNTSSRYAGLCHYRRHFELDEDLLCRLSDSDIDVVVTIPILNFPSVRAVYRQDHVERDWDILMEAIEKISPEYGKAAEKVANGIYYYGYNMFFARKEILNDYCGWLFPILSYCEVHCDKKEDPYQNRYIGFLAERLLTVYLKHHEGKYKVVHARKHFVER